MNIVLLETTSFWDVVWWMIIMFFWIMLIWLFISLFADIFRRRDLSGWGKAGWIFLLFVLPFIGALIYIIARPAPSQEELHHLEMPGMHAAGPTTSTDDIARAHEMLKQGDLTQAEFDQIKARALGTG